MTDATARSYGAAGLALLTAGVLGVSPVAAPPSGAGVSTAAVQLTGNPILDVWNQDLEFLGLDNLDPKDLLNIPGNLLVDLLNMPYNWIKAVGEYATAGLGYPGVVGTAGMPTDYDPAHPEPVLVGDEDNPAPDGYYAPIGMNHEYIPVGFGGTGSWWMESTGNTWGWDEGNFGQVLAISHMVVPIPQWSTAFAYELQALAMQQVVANPEACPFECHDILGYLGRWFNVPLNKMFEGVTVGLNFGGDDGTASDPTGDPIMPMGQELSWAGEKVQFDPFFIFTNFFKSLTMDPDETGNDLQSVLDNYLSLITHPGDAINPFLHIVQDLFNDFFPLLPGSFVYWGAPGMYTVPALTGGLISSFTGFANPMAQYTMAPGGAFALGPYFDEEIVGGEKLNFNNVFPGIYGVDVEVNGETIHIDAQDPDYDPLGHSIGPFDLPLGLAAGFSYWIAGLLGYLDPYTYLHTLGVEYDMDADQVNAVFSGLLDKIGLDNVDLGWLADGFAGWHDGLDNIAIHPLQNLGDLLVPWYHDLTVGAGLDAGSQVAAAMAADAAPDPGDLVP